MNFQDLQFRLTEYLRELVRSGEVTERGLARITRVSQPHIHHVLKGKRLLSSQLADEILHRLGLDLTDLLRPEELNNKRRKRS
jgi:transcriptional regulator with XRE-family HTH domain